MEDTKGEQCSERVAWDSWHTKQCERKATVEREGKPYCKIHDPEYIKAKEAERTVKWDREWAEKKARRALESTAITACKQINPDNPQAAAESIKDMYEALKELITGDGEHVIEATNRGLKALAKAEVK